MKPYYTAEVKCWVCRGTGKAKVTRMDMLLGSDLRGGIINIIREEAEGAGLTPADLVSATRVPRVVRARDIAAYRMQLELGMTLKAIGYSLGGRDHSTVLEAIRRAKAA